MQTDAANKYSNCVEILASNLTLNTACRHFYTVLQFCRRSNDDNNGRDIDDDSGHDQDQSTVISTHKSSYSVQNSSILVFAMSAYSHSLLGDWKTKFIHMPCFVFMVDVLDNN